MSSAPALLRETSSGNPRSPRSPRRASWCAGLVLLAARAPQQAATQPPAVPAPQPQPVVVPQALRAHVPLAELSGLVWAPPLDR
ncbi:MAG: hypothetical protein ABI560_10955, partial [Myxococcales bacterium]